MDLPSINLITSAPLNDVVRELPVLSLANPGMERIVDSSTAEYTSMLLNCRDGSLAQQLAHKLSIVANTVTSITLRHPSDPTPPPIHTLPPLLQTTIQYNPNIFNGVCHPSSSFSRPFPSPTNPYTHYSNHHFPQQISPNNSGYSQTTTSATTSPYASRAFMPTTTTTTTNQTPDCQSILYPQTSPLATHRPTRPTAVVPPLPKDPIISSPVGSITAVPSMISSSSSSSSNNYQQVSPQKSSNNESNYQKQIDTLQSHEHTNKNSQSVTNNNVNEDMTKKKPSPVVQQEPHQQIEKIRINLHKIQNEEPVSIKIASPLKQRSIKPNIPQQLNHLPADFTPDLIKELLQDGYSLDNNSGERLLRQRRSGNSNTTSLNNSPKKKRIRSLSTEDDDDIDDNNNNNDDDDINDIDKDEEQQPLKKRIRRTNDNSINNNSIDVMSALNKKTRDRLARKALDIDADPQENTSYQRFIQLLDIFNDDYERHHEQFEQTPDDHYLDLLLSDHTLDEMAILSEKLKLSTYMSRIDRMKLKRLLEILSLRIKQGIEISPILKHDINDEQTNEEEERIWRDLVFERLTMCANACEISLNIMTTDNIPKEILIEHVIENTALFIKAQLAKTIFPEYDPLYRNDNHSKDPLLTKQKRSKVTGTKCKQVQILYNKIVSLFQGITDLMPLGKYTDTIILAYAKMFHIGQWLRDINLTVERLTQTLTRRIKSGQTELVDDDVDESMNNNNNNSKPSISIEDEIEMKKNEKISILKMLSMPETARKQQRYTLDIEYDDIYLLMRYLTSNRPFLKTFDVYLKQLAAIFQSEAGTNIRSKAMKCLCTVVEADPTVLARNDIKSCVKVGLTDKSISVREAAIDLIGRYIVQKQELILQYYDVLCERSIDTGVSVRKRVVKIFRDVCLTQPSFNRIPDICSRLLRRIHDEESIRKLVLETFQQLWFSPTRNQQDVRQRVQTIIDVLVDAQKQNYTWLENLVKEFLQTNDKQSIDDKKKVREQRKDVLKAIQDIINELVESILKIESANDQVSSNKMVATFIALYALGKAKPEHVLPHVSAIVEYLNIKCTSYNDNIIVQYVAKILEFTVPLMKSASASIIYSLEGSLTKLLLVSGQLVIHSSIACLSAVIRLSKNTQLVKDVFIRYHSIVVQCQQKILEKPNEEFKGSAQLARSIYILGVLCKYFDVEKPEFDDLEFSVDDLFQLFIFLVQRPESVVKLKSLVGLGFFLQRYGQYLIRDTVRQLYHTYLLDRRPAAAQLRCQVLINLEEYFRDCIRRMAEQDVDYLHLTSTVNSITTTTTTTIHDDENSNDASGPTGASLKDTTDVHSEMASSIAQCYLRIVLDTYLSEDETIRQCVRKVVTCILEQGLVHPVQFIPYLIAMTTDRDTTIQQSAEQNLQDLDKTNPGIIQTKVMHGFKMSYQLQKLLAIANNNKNNQQTNSQFDVIRGMTKVAITPANNQQSPYCSVNHFLYSLIRSSRVYRRGLISQLLKMFDNDTTTTTSTTLEEQLFVADNLAYFPYQVQDEPLYLIEQIDLSVSVSGSTQLQQFRDLLKQYLDYIDDDEGIDINKLEDKFLNLSDIIIDELNQCLRTSKSTMLLLLLKSYLKDVYSLNDTKITEYDHTESSKITDRPIISRKINVKFEPKIILDTIKPSNHIDNIQRRKQILKDFADFKRYLLAFDTDIDDTIQSITELLPTTSLISKNKKKSGGTNKRRKVMIDSDDDSADGNFQP
ncbi:unnamed protein product [Rotaria sp. Silwood2]|nr:unnamed protein product [Rotaria sp. Silwood2]